MRRPAQHHLGPTASHGWVRPYTGLAGLAVFYNGPTTTAPPAVAPAPAAPVSPPVPTPADIATRAAQQPAATPAAPPAPAGGDEQLVTVPQRRLNVMMKDEKDEGRRAAYRAIAEAAGIDPETFDPSKFGEVFKQAEKARQAQLSEEQRRTEELAAREQAIQAREEATVQREVAAAERDRESKVRAALVRLGATGDDLDDAARLITVPADADDQKITEAAEALQKRRAELFGGPAPAQQLPPAPSGAPAAGNAPRQPASGKSAITDKANARAEAMGLRKPAA